MEGEASYLHRRRWLKWTVKDSLEGGNDVFEPNHHEHRIQIWEILGATSLFQLEGGNLEVAIFMRYEFGDHNSQLRPGLVEDMQARMNR